MKQSTIKKAKKTTQLTKQAKKPVNKSLATTSQNFNVKTKKVDASKFHDKFGTSLKKKYSAEELKEITSDAKRKVVIDKSSKYGISPQVAYDEIDYSKQTKKVFVVKKFQKKEFKKIQNAIQCEARDISISAANMYGEEVVKAKMTTEKNMLIARIESLRLMNKALTIEKKYKENLIETTRHKKVLADIKKIKIDCLTNNDLILKDSILKIALNREVELNNCLEDKIRLEEKIQEQLEINDAMNKWKQKRIKVMASGNKFEEKISRKDIKVNLNRSFMVLNNYSNEEMLEVYNTMKNAKKLSAREQSIFDKISLKLNNDKAVNKLVNKSQASEKQISILDEKILTAKKQIANKSQEREFVVISMDEYKKITLNAKKNNFVVSESVEKFATEYRTLHDYYNKKSPKAKKTSATSTALTVSNSPKKVNVEDKYSEKAINDTIKKWKTIEKKVVKSDKYDVAQNQADQYTIYYENLKKQSLFEKYQDARSERALNQPEKIIRYSSSRLNHLKSKLNQLPSDPVVATNKNYFISENINLENLIKKFNAIDVYNLEKTPQNDKLILEVEKVLEIYKFLVKEDKIARLLISKSQIYDEKLQVELAKQKEVLAKRRESIETSYIARIETIEAAAKKKSEFAEQKHLVNREKIFEIEQKQIAKEEELHSRNKAYNAKGLYEFVKRSYKLENKEIDSVVKSLNQYNRRFSSKISMAKIPTKIENVVAIDNNNITLQKRGSIVYAVTNNPESKQIFSGQLINKQLPSQPVTKIVVLDKFRNVSNVLDRVEMLKELSEVSFAKALKFNNMREKEEILAAERKLSSKLKTAQKLLDNSITFDNYATRLANESATVDHIQKNYENKKAAAWREYEKAEAFKKKQMKLELSQVERMNKKAQLEKARTQKKAESIKATSNELAVYNKKTVNNDTKKIANTQVKQLGFKNKFKNVFSKKSVDIDDVIGKK